MVLHWIPDSVVQTSASGTWANIKEETKGEHTKSLLPQGNLLQLLKSVFLCRTVNDRVLQQVPIYGVMIHRRLHAILPIVSHGLQLPRVTALVVHEARVVVALVEVLQHR